MDPRLQLALTVLVFVFAGVLVLGGIAQIYIVHAFRKTMKASSPTALRQAALRRDTVQKLRDGNHL